MNNTYKGIHYLWMPFVYVIAASDEGPVKLGRSADPEARLKQLQTGHAQPLKLYYTEEFSKNRVNLIERLIHKENKHHRLSGEWFKLPVDKAILEVQYARIRYGDEDDPCHK